MVCTVNYNGQWDIVEFSFNKSHCLQRKYSNLNKKVKSDFFQWDIVEFLQFNKSHCLQEYIYIYNNIPKEIQASGT